MLSASRVGPVLSPVPAREVKGTARTRTKDDAVRLVRGGTFRRTRHSFQQLAEDEMGDRNGE